MLKKYLMIFLVSMVPLIELRGAVPIAVGMNLPLFFLPVLYFKKACIALYNTDFITTMSLSGF